MENSISKLVLLTGSLMIIGIACSNILNDPSPRNIKNLELEDQLLSTKLFAPLIKGTVSAPVPKDPILPVRTEGVRWGKIPTSNNGEPLVLAVGTAITAGYRDGGLFRQGQLTAYPNLIAQQMGLKNFNSGAFSPTAGNGTGYLELVNEVGIPEYKLVTNDLARKQSDPVRYERVDQPVSNFGIPFLDYHSAGSSPAAYAEHLAPNGYQEREGTRYFMRYLPDNSENSRISPVKAIENRPQPDLGFLEFGFTDYLGFYQTAGRVTDYGFYQNGFYPNYDILVIMGKNTIVMTVPEVRDLPYFHFVTAKELLANGEVTHNNSWNGQEEKLNVGDLVLPTPYVLDFLAKPTYPAKLRSEDVLSENERGFGVENYNKLIYRWAAETKNPVFDLHGLYKRVQRGGYVTDDGYAINPDFRFGNFFSSDGLHPSAIGHAVIANELIKFINEKYQSQIPLINVREFAKQFGK